MITVGLVLTFATSWVAYQSLVWNLAVGAPDQLAALLTGSGGPATQVFAEKIDVVFTALVDASPQQATVRRRDRNLRAPGLLWLGATLLLLGTVGVLATSKIALAILLGLGPVFVVLALFPSTRGLFTGWLKGAVLLALAPLFAVLGGSLMLELSIPVLRALVQIARRCRSQGGDGVLHDRRGALRADGHGAQGRRDDGRRMGRCSGWSARPRPKPTARAKPQAAAAARAAAPPPPAIAAAAPPRAATPAPSREIRLAPARPPRRTIPAPAPAPPGARPASSPARRRRASRPTPRCRAPAASAAGSAPPLQPSTRPASPVPRRSSR